MRTIYGLRVWKPDFELPLMNCLTLDRLLITSLSLDPLTQVRVHLLLGICPGLSNPLWCSFWSTKVALGMNGIFPHPLQFLYPKTSVYSLSLPSHLRINGPVWQPWNHPKCSAAKIPQHTPSLRLITVRTQVQLGTPPSGALLLPGPILLSPLWFLSSIRSSHHIVLA